MIPGSPPIPGPSYQALLSLTSPYFSSSVSWHLSSVQKFSVNFLFFFFFYKLICFQFYLVDAFCVLLPVAVRLGNWAGGSIPGVLPRACIWAGEALCKPQAQRHWPSLNRPKAAQLSGLCTGAEAEQRLSPVLKIAILILEGHLHNQEILYTLSFQM